MRTIRLPFILLGLAAGLPACGGEEVDRVGAVEPAGARTTIERLRAQHLVSAGTRPVLGPTAGVRLVSEGARLHPVWDEPPATGIDVSFPASAQDAFQVRHAGSGVAVAARMLQARRGRAGSVDGYVVYPAAGPNGGTLVHRVIDAGTEDFVAFDARPDRGEVSYDIELSSEVAGLRLVGNSLEFLDRASTPRLRVAPPFIVGKDGKVVEGALTLDGCAADRNPAAPWDRPVVAPGATHCRLAVRWDADAVSYPAILDPSWTGTGSMATGRTHFIGVAINTGRVLVSGGWSPSRRGPELGRALQPDHRHLGNTASMGVARADHAAALRGNGQVLVTGGNGGSGSLSSAQTYDPAAGTWTTRAAMNRARENHRATTLANGDVLSPGGTSDESLGAQRFSELDRNLEQCPGTMLSYHAQHSATLLANGNVLSVGGAAPAGQIFNPSNNTWSATSTGASPQPRSTHTGTRLLDGKVLIAGGSAGGGDSSTELFDPATGVWSRTGNMWQSHAQHTATLLTDGRVAVYGNSFGNSRTLTEIFSPTWGTWSPGPTLATPRDGHIAARLSERAGPDRGRHRQRHLPDQRLAAGCDDDGGDGQRVQVQPRGRSRGDG